MTTQQQQIINLLVAEFERINATNTRKRFNLIDSAALQDDTNRKKLWEQLSEENLKTWENAANEETNRIIGLLREDLPSHVIVEKYNDKIGKYDLPKLQIRHETTHCRAHHESLVTIEVYVFKDYKQDEYGNSAKFGEEFLYKTYPMKGGASAHGYKTIEDAVNDPYFKEALRNRVIR